MQDRCFKRGRRGGKGGSLQLTGMMFPTWYGRPQLAKDTYGPRSNMVICAASLRRRRRAAQEAAGRHGGAARGEQLWEDGPSRG